MKMLALVIRMYTICMWTQIYEKGPNNVVTLQLTVLSLSKQQEQEPNQG